MPTLCWTLLATEDTIVNTNGICLCFLYLLYSAANICMSPKLLCQKIYILKRLNNCEALFNSIFILNSVYVIRMGKQLKILPGHVDFQNVPSSLRQLNVCRQKTQVNDPIEIAVFRCSDRNGVSGVQKIQVGKGSVDDLIMRRCEEAFTSGRSAAQLQAMVFAHQVSKFLLRRRRTFF